MELKGTVILKKITPENAIYGVSIPGAGHMTLYIPKAPKRIFGVAGEVTVNIPDPLQAEAKKAKK